MFSTQPIFFIHRWLLVVSGYYWFQFLGHHFLGCSGWILNSTLPCLWFVWTDSITVENKAYWWGGAFFVCESFLELLGVLESEGLSSAACPIWSFIATKLIWNVVLLLTLKCVLFCTENVDLNKLLIILYKYLQWDELSISVNLIWLNTVFHKHREEAILG